MALAQALWARRDALLAVFLAIAYVVETLTERPAVHPPVPLIEGAPMDETVTRVAAVAFLLSLAVRVSAPLVPQALAFMPLAIGGVAPLGSTAMLLGGLLLTCYSAGAWTSGRSAAIGGLGVGALVGIAVLREAGEPVAARAIATPSLLLAGAWLVGLAAREIRIGSGHPRLSGTGARGTDGTDRLSPEHQETAREIRDVIERSLSVVVLQARAGLRHLDHDPERARQALEIIESTGSDAIADTQRLTGELLSPGTTVPVTPSPRLADLDYLADQVSDAGLPVDLRVEGRAVALSPEVEALAYRVVQEALINALEHAGPARASVVVRYDHDVLTLDVSDDGKGVPDDSDGGMADLLAVREAVAALGGTLHAGPRDRRGYRVEAHIPIEPDW